MPTNLDDANVLRTLDPDDMMGLVLGFPEQCEKAIAIARSAPIAPLPTPPASVIVTGLGGSAIGGDLLRALMESEASIPCFVNRDYHLPSFVGPSTLVITASYSGNTEETLSAYADARRAGAQVVAITSGGTLGEQARTDGYTVITVPGGQPPRSATGYLFFPMLIALERLGILSDQSAAIDEALAQLRAKRDALRPDVPSVQNPAKQMANALYGRLPVVHGTTGYLSVAAVRWKCQFHENAKTLAISSAYPELDHNEIVGWAHARAQASNWSLITLRDPDLSAKMQKRVEVTTGLIGDTAQKHDITAEGDSLLARMLGAIYLGDWVSLYLAYAYNLDPTAIENIDTLKAELGKVPA